MYRNNYKVILNIVHHSRVPIIVQSHKCSTFLYWYNYMNFLVLCSRRPAKIIWTDHQSRSPHLATRDGVNAGARSHDSWRTRAPPGHEAELQVTVHEYRERPLQSARWHLQQWKFQPRQVCMRLRDLWQTTLKFIWWSSFVGTEWVNYVIELIYSDCKNGLRAILGMTVWWTALSGSP